MKTKLFSQLQQGVWMAGLASLVAVAPVVAQTANFAPLILERVAAENPVYTGSTTGYTGGFYPLPEIATLDRTGNFCLGFADSTPDHVMQLNQAFSTLTVEVNSGGNNTTLLIKGPGNVIRCGRDISRTNLDERIQDSDWSQGTYEIWVGAQDPNTYDYTITASGTP